MSNPLREQFGFNTNLTGYTQWTPALSAEAAVFNSSESYYISSEGNVIQDICAAFAIASDTTSIEFSVLPIVASAPQVVSNSVSLRRVEDNSTIDATFDIDATANNSIITLNTDGTTLLAGGFYVVCGNITYTDA